jgi:hypothetical protein
MLRKTLILAAAALFTHAASADVMYSWQQTTHSPSTPDGLHLELVFSDAAVANGSFDLNLMNMCTLAGACDQQQDGLLALRYWYAGLDGAEHWNRIDYHIGDEMKDGYQMFSMALSFLPGGTAERRDCRERRLFRFHHAERRCALHPGIGPQR